MIDQLENIAKEKGHSVPQIAIAWVSSLSKRNGNAHIIPIPGASTVAKVDENMKQVDWMMRIGRGLKTV